MEGEVLFEGKMPKHLFLPVFLQLPSRLGLSAVGLQMPMQKRCSVQAQQPPPKLIESDFVGQAGLSPATERTHFRYGHGAETMIRPSCSQQT